MGIDSNSLLTSLGVFSATVGTLSVCTNLISYYGTKFKLNRSTKQYGKDYAEEMLDKWYNAYKSPVPNLFGGFGFKLLKKKYVF